MNVCDDFSYLPPFKLRLTASNCSFYQFIVCYFFFLQVSPEVTALFEVSPRLLFNVHVYRSGHMQAFKI